MVDFYDQRESERGTAFPQYDKILFIYLVHTSEQTLCLEWVM